MNEFGPRPNLVIMSIEDFQELGDAEAFEVAQKELEEYGVILLEEYDEEAENALDFYKFLQGIKSHEFLEAEEGLSDVEYGFLLSVERFRNCYSQLHGTNDVPIEVYHVLFS